MCKVNNIKDPFLKAIEKYKKHPSMKTIAGLSKNDNFISEKVSQEEMLHEIKQLYTREAYHDTDIPSKIVKTNSDVFADFLYENDDISVSAES